MRKSILLTCLEAAVWLLLCVLLLVISWPHGLGMFVNGMLFGICLRDLARCIRSLFEKPATI